MKDLQQKQEMYRRLVEKRKACRLCQELKNPSEEGCRQYDSDQIGPWSLWQGNLESEVIIVGKDWAGTDYWIDWKGRDEPSGNDTNEHLQEVLEHIGIRIGKPREEKDNKLFFTNMVLCLKPGYLGGDVRDRYMDNCAAAIFKPLVDIIEPKAIVALGEQASKAILRLYGIRHIKSSSVKSLILASPFKLTNKTVLFPRYHLGYWGWKYTELWHWDEVANYLRDI